MDIEQTLRLACMPRDPEPQFEESVMARLSAAGTTPSSGSRRGPRIIIVSSLLVLAAAAGMLVSQLASTPAQVSAALPVIDTVPMEPVPVVPAIAAVATAPVTDVVTISAAEVQTTKPAEAKPPAPNTFTVLVRPLQLDTTDVAGQAKARQYFDALLDELRTVPGLKLVAPDAVAATTAPADFRITVTGDDTRQTEQMAGVAMWQVSVRTEAWRGDAYRQEQRGSFGSGGTMKSPDCPQDTGRPVKCGPAASVASQVARLMTLFPANPELVAQLSARNREQAELRSASGTEPTVIKIDPLNLPAAVAMDAKLIQNILERIAAAPTPAVRAVLWTTLRGQQQPELLQRLLQALREESAETVRREIITQLALVFSNDAAARAALATVVAGESRTMSRHIAERALSGDSAWRDYVEATVRDTGLPTEERLVPLTWMIAAKQLDPRIDATFNDLLPALLDGDGTRVLADLLCRNLMGNANMLDSLGGLTVLARISAVDLPSVTDLQVVCFDTAPSEITLRALASRSSDPRVRKKLEAIVASDADPKLRQQAAANLRQGPSSPTAAPTGN